MFYRNIHIVPGAFNWSLKGHAIVCSGYLFRNKYYENYTQIRINLLRIMRDSI